MSGKGLGGEQVEGRQAVRELLIAGVRKVSEIWLSSELAEDEGVADIVALARANRVPVAHVARNKLEARARTESPQGVIAYADELPEADFGELLKRRPGRPPFLVAIDGVTDPGNLGAIIRNCDGAGVDGILVPRHRSVHVTPTVAKAVGRGDRAREGGVGVRAAGRAGSRQGGGDLGGRARRRRRPHAVRDR